MIAEAIAVFLALVVLIAGPSVVLAIWRYKGVSALEEAHRRAYMDELKQPAGAPPAPPWVPRPVSRRRRAR